MVLDAGDGTAEVVHTGLSDTQLEQVRNRVYTPLPEGTLRCPLARGDVVYGELVLLDSAAGAFSEDDGELARALVSTAATALSNARLYEESNRQQHWLRANAQIIRQLLTLEGEDPLAVVARRAADVADADLVTVALLSEDDTEVVVEAGAGARADEFLGQRFPVAGTLAATALAREVPTPVADYSEAVPRSQQLTTGLDAGPVMLVPLVGSQRTWGVLSLMRTQGRRVFSPEDLAMAQDFANHATVSLELAEARDTEHRMQLMEDRDRIARDLHDHVIQELFATGLGLESLAGSDGLSDGARQSLRDRVDDLDRTIRRIRTSIFGLRGTVDRTRDELRSAVLDLVSELTPHLGFAPAVQFSGAPGMVDDGLVDDVTAVVREALSNVARHARADSAVVELLATADRLVVTVSDDGVGIGATPQLGGTANLHARAQRWRGKCTVSPGAVRGTVLIWEAELT